LILCADARAIPLKDATVQCCVTSPPYWGLRDYGTPGQLGLEATPEEYVANMVEVFREVRRVLKDDGVLWLNLGDCYATGAGKVGECPGGGAQGERWAGRDDHKGRGTPARCGGRTRGPRPGEWYERENPRKNVGPITQPNRMPIPGLKPKDLVGIPWRVAFALQADGWWLRSCVVWAKGNPMPESIKDRPTTAHEFIFLMAKSERYFYNADAIREPHTYGIGGGHHRNVLTPPESHVPGAREHKGIRKSPRVPSGWDTGPGDHHGKTGRYKTASLEHHGGRGLPPESREPGAFNPLGRNKRTVWTINTQPYPGSHFATFPEEIPRLCILAGSRPGDVVLDPFGGSGTTAKVALELGRRPIHLDLTYHELARKRCRVTPSMAGLLT
jgi:DNA modification methylase